MNKERQRKLIARERRRESLRLSKSMQVPPPKELITAPKKVQAGDAGSAQTARPKRASSGSSTTKKTTSRDSRSTT